MTSARRLALPTVAALALTLGACGSGAGSSADAGTEPGTVESSARETGQLPEGVPIDAFLEIDRSFVLDGRVLSADDVVDITEQMEALAPGAVIFGIRPIPGSIAGGRVVESFWAIDAEVDGEEHTYGLVDHEVVPIRSHEYVPRLGVPVPPLPEVPIADLVATALDEHPGEVLAVERPLLTDQPVVAVAIREEDDDEVRVTLDSTTDEILHTTNPSYGPIFNSGRDDDLPGDSALGLPADAFEHFDEMCEGRTWVSTRRESAIEDEAIYADGDPNTYLIEQSGSTDGYGSRERTLRFIDSEGVTVMDPRSPLLARTAFADMPDDERAAYEGWSVPIAESWLAAIEARPGQVMFFAVPDGADRPMTSFCIRRDDRSYDRVTVDGVTGEVLAATLVDEGPMHRTD